MAFCQSDGFEHLMRPDGSGVHMLDEHWRAKYKAVCNGSWSPDGTRLVVAVTTGKEQVRTAVVDVDAATGLARQTTELPFDSSGANRWSPDGAFLVIERRIENDYNLWIVRPDRTDLRPLTNLKGNNRAPAWQTQPSAIYFRKDFKAIWRMPMRADGTAAGPAMPWMEIPGVRFDWNSFDVTPDSQHILVSIITPGSDIWLVERGPR